MLPILLDAPCDRHCDACHPDPTPTNILHTVINCIGLFATILFPLYKTYKALESGKLRPARAMLAFWSVSTLITCLKGVVDETFGAYSKYVVYQMILLMVKLIPMIVGPDKIYASLIRPVFAREEDDVDKVLLKAFAVKEAAEEEIVEPLKKKIKNALPMKKNSPNASNDADEGPKESTMSSLFVEKVDINDVALQQRQSGQYWKSMNQINNDSSMRRRRIPLNEDDEFGSTNTKSGNQAVLSEEELARKAQAQHKLEEDKKLLNAELHQKVAQGHDTILHPTHS